MDKRKHPRIPIDDLNVDVSDGFGFFSGSASDISRFGLGLVNMAKRLGKDAEKFTVVVSGQGKDFKFKVFPRWEEVEGLTKRVGVEIANAPWEWTEFVMEREPVREEEDDPWGDGR